MATGRRRFLARAIGGAAGAMLMGPARTARAATYTSGDAWLDAIAGKRYKVFLDVSYFAPDGASFRRTRALLTVLHENYGTAEDAVGIAFGAHSSALAYLLTPAAWDDLGLVELVAGSNLRPADAQTVRSATKNWGILGADNVAELRQRGVRFLACRQTMGIWAGKLASAHGGSAEEYSARIIKGLHDGVEPVPAMIAAAVVAESRGLGYVSIT
jgi:intracellular sulfur oxidation DsrE/DsrF family protein